VKLPSCIGVCEEGERKGWVTQQAASERARDGRGRSSEGGIISRCGGISGRRKKGGGGGDHDDVEGNVEGDGIVWLGGSWDPVLTVRTGQGGRRREGRRGSSGGEEERSAKIERRSRRRLNEEQQRRRRIVRKGLWRTSL
jgi:hypothetical protein